MFAPLHDALQRCVVSLRALLTIVLVVVLAHAVFLQHARLAASSAEGRTRASVTVVQARTLHAVAQPQQVAPPVTPTVDPTPSSAPTRAARPAARKPAPEPAATEPQAAAPAGTPVPGPDLPLNAEPIPTYPTSIPQPFTQVYELRRGALVGRGELSFQPAGDAYEARLTTSLGEAKWLEWISRGGFDAAGIAPLRFTDQRRGRAAQAANFQRLGSDEGATISYSGPAVRHALHAGAQDRLTWIVQLSAIAQGRGVTLSGGASIVMFVSGARGDADVWIFTVVGPERVDTAGGSVESVKLVREPRRPYDTLAEIWLDPAQAHLPAKLRFSSTPRGDALEFVLQQTTTAARP